MSLPWGRTRKQWLADCMASMRSSLAGVLNLANCLARPLLAGFAGAIDRGLGYEDNHHNAQI